MENYAYYQYSEHYHFAGKAVRDFPAWVYVTQDDSTGKTLVIYCSDDGFGNLISADRYQILQYSWGQHFAH